MPKKVVQITLVVYKSNAAYMSALKLACIGCDVQSHNQSNGTICKHNNSVYAPT